MQPNGQRYRRLLAGQAAQVDEVFLAGLLLAGGDVLPFAEVPWLDFTTKSCLEKKRYGTKMDGPVREVVGINHPLAGIDNPRGFWNLPRVEINHFQEGIEQEMHFYDIPACVWNLTAGG